MGICIFCKTETIRQSDDYMDDSIHYSCLEERMQREQNRLCVVCGETLSSNDKKNGVLKHNRCAE